MGNFEQSGIHRQHNFSRNHLEMNTYAVREGNKTLVVPFLDHEGR
jgi:hypothetical protein